jgi:hypothetical protein
MEQKMIMLRFRDLVTEPGGTIIEHRSLIRSHGEVWWGWWKREYEVVPRHIFAEMSNEIDKKGTVKGYVFDVSNGKIYSCNIAKVKVSPTKSGMSSPEPERSPEYYQRGRYTAWIMLKSIEDEDINSLNLMYDSAPTNPKESSKYKPSGIPLQPLDTLSEDDNVIRTFRDLRKLDVTMWLLKNS